MKNLLALAFMLSSFLFIISCSDDGDTIVQGSSFSISDATEFRGPDEDDVVAYPQKEISGVINENITLTNDTVWVLKGRVIVDAGTTLTINPGTIIKGTEGQGALSSVLLVASGATIQANGTAADPIVMTSILDNINVAGLPYYDGSAIVQNGDGFTSTLDVDSDLGKWGGLIMLGSAPISSGDGATTAIEGIPSSVTQAIYGGSNAADNSGSVTYVSIRFTGTQLGPGNELQGLTLGGVGSGTTISNVESIASADDGIEIFGGSVNLSNFIVWGQEDDGYDCDQAWTGTINNFLYLGTNATADHGFELDGPEGSATGTGNFTNGTMWGANSSGMADFRDGAVYTLDKVLFFNFKEGADIELDAGDADDECAISASYLAGDLKITNTEFRTNGVASLDAIMDNKCSTGTAKAEADAIFVLAANTNSVLADAAAPTVGADISVFDWSYTKASFAGWSEIPSVQ